MSGAAAGFGDHEGHAVHPHDHGGQDRDRRLDRDWCSGRWQCRSCVSEDLPRGTWFAGPRCVRPKAAARESAR